MELRNLCAELRVPFSYSGRIPDFSRGDSRRPALVNQLERAPSPRIGREPVHLLTGIARCAICDDGLRFKRRRLASRAQLSTYRCPLSSGSFEPLGISAGPGKSSAALSPRAQGAPAPYPTCTVILCTRRDHDDHHITSCF